jgi:AcrR family transcriptional regulator
MQRAEATEEARPGAKWLVRRDAIFDTSARVFARGGYHGTGIAELFLPGIARDG